MKCILSILLLTFSTSCITYYNLKFRTKVKMGLIDLDEPPPPGAKLTGFDFRLFRETPVWELAKAAVIEDTDKMQQITEESKIDVDYREPKFEKSLLSVEVMNERYESVRTLLELGANPNIKGNEIAHAYSPMMYAASVKDTRILKLILEYGGNPNIEAKFDPNGNGKITHTPLLNASKRNLENVKLLIQAGANINFKNEGGSTPLTEALTHNHLEVVLFLLESGVEYKHQFGVSNGKNYNRQGDYPTYLADELRFNILPLNSERYKQKMKVVSFLKKNGIDYRATPIPLGAINEAKRLYPNNWEDYLDKY